MRTLFTYQINRTSAYFSFFILGLSTLLFLLFIATEAQILLGLGFGLLIIAAILAPIALTILIVNSCLHYKDIKQHVLAIFMVLVSISMALFYTKLLSDF